MAEPLKNTDADVATGVYDTSPRPVTTNPQPVTTMTAISDPANRWETPWTNRDTVRWGPILAGLFPALSSLVVLAVLGLAVGLSAVDANDRLSDFGMGAGWWGAISALLAFLIGGFVAGTTASLVRGTPHGAVNGLMVWAVAIPLMLFLLTGGISTALRAAGNVAGTAATAAAPALGEATQGMAAGTAPETLAAQAQSAVTQATTAVTAEDVEQTAQTAAPGAWWTLASLLLALIAAVAGGVMGGRWHAKNEHEDRNIHTVAT